MSKPAPEILILDHQISNIICFLSEKNLLSFFILKKIRLKAKDEKKMIKKNLKKGLNDDDLQKNALFENFADNVQNLRDSNKKNVNTPVVINKTSLQTTPIKSQEDNNNVYYNYVNHHQQNFGTKRSAPKKSTNIISNQKKR